MILAARSRPADTVDAATLYRLTVAQYHRMGDAGILDENDPVELLEGLLYEKRVLTRETAPGTVNLDELFPLTVEQYDAMGAAGILPAGDRVELVQGILFHRMTILPPHTGTVIRLSTVLRPQLPTGWRYRQEQPLVLSDGEPLPDGLIATGSDDDNFRFHPHAADAAMVIEVADSTLLHDRTVKLRSYARAGIPVYWIVNLVERQIEVYTDPTPTAVPAPAYRQRAVFLPGQTVVVPVVDRPVPVTDLLPPA